MPQVIRIRNARVHNLKSVSVDIPREKLVVITGLSGSGKSSLAFDTLYAEGQRRYVESLSAYARQFLGLMDKPDVESIEGLSPAISIDQKSTTRNPRSTVGTVTEIYDYLRLLFARVGIPHCPRCNRPVRRQTVQEITDQIVALPSGTNLLILAPKVRDRKGDHQRILREIAQQGYVRVRLDGVVYELDEALQLALDKQKRHSIEVVVDRLIIDQRSEDRSRVADSVETAVRLGEGTVVIEDRAAGRDLTFSEQFACPDCRISLPELEPRMFSFNSPHGACPTCTGLGTQLDIDPDLVVPNPALSINEGAIKPWAKRMGGSGWALWVLEAVARRNHFSLDSPWSKLPASARKVILYGTGEEETYHVRTDDGDVYPSAYEGVVSNLLRRYKETDSEYARSEIERFMITKPCPACGGKRLKPEALAVRVRGKSIHEVVTKSVADAQRWFSAPAASDHGSAPAPAGGTGDPASSPGAAASLRAGSPEAAASLRAGQPATLRVAMLAGALGPREQKIAKPIHKEILARFRFLENVGLDYLTLDRAAATLAGGEAQRIRLATQIGSGLTGVLYILDEPSIGLHQRDNLQLIATLRALRDLQNTIIVVEHDEETIQSADWVVDMGPGAGEHGGEVVFAGTPKKLASAETLTGKYLAGRLHIDPPKRERKGNGKALVIRKASEHNLRDIDVRIPLGVFVCVTGVSGSGKSTLVNDILARALGRAFHGAKEQPGVHEKIEGLHHLNKVILIDQSPIGRTPRSNAATYTGLFTPIRELFASVPEAKARGYDAGRFSFNVRGGRCETCQGDGMLRIEMQFLPDVYIECDACQGKRYNREALTITVKGVTIADVLNMTVEHAHEFFRAIPAIASKLAILEEVGLGYLHLGQPATQLSGGEAQRIKLSTELSRRATGKTLYLLDEPTTGLHFDDVRRLLSVLQALVDKGNSVLVIEHNLEVIKCADWVIDLGPEGGGAGGAIVAEGTPREVARVKNSYTGQYLKRYFERDRGRHAPPKRAPARAPYKSSRLSTGRAPAHERVRAR